MTASLAKIGEAIGKTKQYAFLLLKQGMPKCERCCCLWFDEIKQNRLNHKLRKGVKQCPACLTQKPVTTFGNCWACPQCFEKGARKPKSPIPKKERDYECVKRWRQKNKERHYATTKRYRSGASSDKAKAWDFKNKQKTRAEQSTADAFRLMQAASELAKALSNISDTKT